MHLLKNCFNLVLKQFFYAKIYIFDFFIENNISFLYN